MMNKFKNIKQLLSRLTERILILSNYVIFDVSHELRNELSKFRLLNFLSLEKN